MSQKSWGPFTGAQLTVIATAALLCLAIPGGLWAAAAIQYSYVSIYDPGSKQRVKLGAGGAVKVTNGAGPLVVSDGGGALTVDGNVTALAASPANFVHVNSFLSANQCKLLTTTPVDQALVITRLIVNLQSIPTAGTSGVYFTVNPIGTTCNGPAIFGVTPQWYGVTDLDLDPGFVLPPNSKLYTQSATSAVASVDLIGFAIPASALSKTPVASR